ncbi:response regulator [Paenibacillus sp.]|uniref:response regulator n=1 Tax=Paenibacillus sp. TaxID=58172 RepID=UPI0028123C60|nr:response regulator [Paenibacillus sp.]
MYSILLVDDEKLELETLERYVDWNAMDISVAGTAANGKEALQALESCRPDIVLTDVRMPIMDGLEFARRARQLRKQVKIVFLSGHNEFQYIKAALNVEAAGYLLKPIDLEELEALMERVKRKCEEDRLAAQGEDWAAEKLLLQMIRESDPARLKERAEQLAMLASGLSAGAELLTAAVTIDADGGTAPPPEWLRTLQTELQASFARSIVAELAPGAYAVASQAKPGMRLEADRAYWEALRRRLEPLAGDGAALTIGLGAVGRGIERLPESYRTAKLANEYKFYLEPGRVIVPEDCGPLAPLEADVEAYAAELVGAVRRGETPAAAPLFALLRDRRIRRNEAGHAAIRLLTAVEHEFSALLAGGDQELLFADHWKELSALTSLGRIETYVLRYAERVASLIKERDADRSRQVADRIVRLIGERYHLPLTVDDIAKEIYLSPNYIRTLFKEKTGETIHEYLTRIRMGRAAELLKDKSLKVHEVSHAVGYENVSYFCSVFYKHKGSTPNEYRKAYT